MPKSKTPSKPEAAKGERLIAYKGFGLDWKCRDFQFQVGASYKHEGKVEACASGFHSCEYPLNVFDYYPPALSRFAEVEIGGAMERHGSDTKVASAEITVRVELSLSELIERAVKWVFDRSTPEEGGMATGDQGAASATGTQGAASATGTQGAASATGDQGAASATGYQGAASATGKHACAAAFGYEGVALAGETGAIFLVCRDYATDEILHVFASKVGENGIEPNKRYRLGEDGKPVEVVS